MIKWFRTSRLSIKKSRSKGFGPGGRRRCRWQTSGVSARSAAASRLLGCTGDVFKAHRLVYHSTLGSRVIKKKKKSGASARSAAASRLLGVQGKVEGLGLGQSSAPDWLHRRRVFNASFIARTRGGGPWEGVEPMPSSATPPRVECAWWGVLRGR